MERAASRQKGKYAGRALCIRGFQKMEAFSGGGAKFHENNQHLPTIIFSRWFRVWIDTKYQYIIVEPYPTRYTRETTDFVSLQHFDANT